MNCKFIQPEWHSIEHELISIHVNKRSFVNHISPVDQRPNRRLQSFSAKAGEKSQPAEIDTQNRNIFISNKRNGVQHRSVSSQTDQEIDCIIQVIPRVKYLYGIHMREAGLDRFKERI